MVRCLSLSGTGISCEQIGSRPWIRPVGQYEVELPGAEKEGSKRRAGPRYLCVMTGTREWPPPEVPDLKCRPPGPATAAWGRRLEAVESRNVTHLAEDFPVFWERAQGVAVQDADENTYLDLTGAFGVAVAGHGHPRIVQAIREQAGRLTHAMGDVHPPVRKVELMERLAGLMPWGDESRMILASSGSEAVEIALKTALLATGRPGIVAFQGGYHGLTLGSLAATSRADFRDPFARRLYSGVEFVPFPGSAPVGGPEPCLERLARALEGGGGDPVGAVIVEPIQGRAGVRVPPPGFLAEVARRTREAGALLILDEIFTGLGRTGRTLACEHEGVEPDLICLGKALGGGLPLSACAGPRAVMDAWPPSSGEALHTSTFLGHPLACAAGLAFLEALKEEELAARAEELGLRLLQGLKARLAGLPGVREVRGRGLFVGVELEQAGAGAAVSAEALQDGLIVLPAGARGEVVELSPPLVITEAEVDRGAALLSSAVARVVRR
jgi:4-aminobutyrate aminotransferase-like enzyme